MDLDVVAGDEAVVREHVGHADGGREHDQDADDAQGGSGIDGVQPAAQRREPCRGRPPDLGKGPAGTARSGPRRRERAQRGDEQEPDDQVAGRPGPQQVAADGDRPRPGHDGDEDDERSGRPEEIQQEHQGGHDGAWKGTRVDHGAPDVRTVEPARANEGDSSIDARMRVGSEPTRVAATRDAFDAGEFPGRVRARRLRIRLGGRGAARQLAQQPAEDDGMERMDGIPVEPPEHATRVERGDLTDAGSPSAVERRDLELEPAAAGEAEIGREAKAPIALVGLDRPVVDDVADGAVLTGAAASAHAGPAGEAIEPAADAPQQVARIPAVGPADAADGREGPRRRDVDVHLAVVDLAPRGGAVGDGAVERLRQRHRVDGEGGAGTRVPHDGRVLQPFDERPADPRLRRRHQPQPQAGQPRRQHGHRNQQAAQAAQPRVQPHHLAVRHHLGTADVEGLILVAGQIDGGSEVAHHVVDGDRLRRRVHPARADHHRQPLHQRPDHLERQAAGADDDRGAELDHRDAGRAQVPPGLGTAAQMRRQRRGVVGQSAQIDDAPHAGSGRGAAEIDGGPAIQGREVGTRPHRVHQVERRVDAGERGVERRRVETVAADHLRAGPGHRHSPRIAGQAADAPGVTGAARFEEAKQTAADVARGAGEQDGGAHGPD